jgi:pimeloyl-ACP methyl ester carboxylesterase
MNTKDSQTQIKCYLHQATKVMCLLVSTLTLWCFAASEAQGQQVVSTTVQSTCNYDPQTGGGSFTDINPDRVSTEVGKILIDNLEVPSSGDLTIPLGSHRVKVIFLQSDWKVVKISVTNHSKERLAKRNYDPEEFKPTSPQGDVTITFDNDGAKAGLSIIVEQCGKGHLPIIFLPGVAGTELDVLKSPEQDNDDCIQQWNCGPEVWPTSTYQERAKLGLKEDGKTRKLLPLDYRITRNRILAGESAADYYSSMIIYLLNKCYYIRSHFSVYEGTHMPENFARRLTSHPPDLFIFPYDWRLDNATHFTALDSVIDDALKLNPNAKKVILLAHSMGGHIARAYILSNSARAAKVDSLITMGTPYWGAAKPYYGAVSGYTFGNKTVRQELMKILIQNFPAAYQLMPNYPFIEDSTNNQKLTLEESYSTQESRRLNYKGFTDVTPGWTNLNKDKYDESADNIWYFNPGLVQLAKDFNRPFGTKDNPTRLPAGVKHYVIIGVGVKTLTYFKMRDARIPERFLELGKRRVVMEPVFWDGDGTVPLKGSEISTADRTYYITYVVNWGPDDSSSHADLPSNNTVQEIVGEIIDGKLPNPSKYSYAGVKDIEEGADFTLHSDANVSITDQSTGRKLGFNNQGGIDEDLPSGTFLSMEGVEYASIADINRALKVTVAGIRQGKFTLDVNVKRAGSTVARFSYVEVPVKPGTVAEVTMTPGQVSAPPPLTVTTDGRTTTIPASIGTGDGPVIPQGGVPPVSTAPIPAPPPSGGIGGTWVTPSGDTIVLTQTGNSVTGTYRGILGTGTLSGTFDGSTFSGTIEVAQGVLAVTDTFSLRLTPEGRLEGRVGSSIVRVDVILTRRR